MLTNTFKKLAHFANDIGVGREVSEKNIKGECKMLLCPTNYLLTHCGWVSIQHYWKYWKYFTWTSFHLTGPSFYQFKISNTNFDHWHITYGQIEPFTFGLIDMQWRQTFQEIQGKWDFASFCSAQCIQSRQFKEIYNVSQDITTYLFTYASYYINFEIIWWQVKYQVE